MRSLAFGRSRFFALVTNADSLYSVKRCFGSIIALLDVIRVELRSLRGTKHHGLVQLHVLKFIKLLLYALRGLLNGLMRGLHH